MTDRLEQAGRRALERAIEAWGKGIVDSPRTAPTSSTQWIDSIIRTSAGLGWPACSPTQREYRGDHDFEWCGAFAAHAWAESIGLATRRLYFSSTFRLDRWAQYRPAFNSANERSLMFDHPRPEDPAQRRLYLRLDAASTPDTVAEFAPRAGDILLVGAEPGLSAWALPYGTHVTVVESYDAKTSTFKTVEGNAHGTQPDGKVRQGVVRQVRPLGCASKPGEYHALRLIRPGLADLP